MEAFELVAQLIDLKELILAGEKEAALVLMDEILDANETTDNTIQ